MQCRRAGMCLCTPFGKLLCAMRLSTYSVLKDLAAPDSAARTALKEGRWALQFEGSLREATDAQDDEEVPPIVAKLFFHIAYCIFKPWRVTWHQLDVCDAPAGEPKSTRDRLYGKVSA